MTPGVTTSVLLPVRNGARHLASALQSLERQTQAPTQVVVVNDASTDGTERVIAAFQQRVPLTVVEGPGAGIAAALNAGLAHCTADWVVRMDADDVMHPERLAAQLSYVAREPEVGVCGTEVLSFPPGRVTERRAHYDAWLSSLHTPEEHARDMYVEATLAHPTAMIRTRLFRSVDGYRTVDWPEDYDLWLRLHGAGVRFGKPNGVLHFWREHPARLSRNHADYNLDAIRRCRLHHLADHWNLRLRGVVVVGAGTEGKLAGRGLLGLGVPILAHVDADPRKVGGRLAGEGGVRVHAPSDLLRLMEATSSPLAVVAIGTHNHRARLRTELAQLGLKEGVDMVMAA